MPLELTATSLYRISNFSISRGTPNTSMRWTCCMWLLFLLLVPTINNLSLCVLSYYNCRISSSFSLKFWSIMILTSTIVMFHWSSSHHHQSLYMLWIFHYIFHVLAIRVFFKSSSSNVIEVFFKVLINLSLEPRSIYLPLTITKASACLEFFTLCSLLLPLDSSSKIAMAAIRNIIICNICDKLIIQV